jgi:hypothetical protein
MTTPDKTSLEALWDGDLGDAMTIYTATDGTEDTYGEGKRTYSGGTAARGRLKIIKANEENMEFGYLVPGDAIALLKLAATVALKDRIGFNSIMYEVKGIMQKKTHKEVALKRLI